MPWVSKLSTHGNRNPILGRSWGLGVLVRPITFTMQTALPSIVSEALKKLAALIDLNDEPGFD